MYKNLGVEIEGRVSKMQLPEPEVLILAVLIGPRYFEGKEVEAGRFKAVCKVHLDAVAVIEAQEVGIMVEQPPGLGRGAAGGPVEIIAAQLMSRVPEGQGSGGCAP